MQPFCINSRGRMVFPSNFRPDLDFSVLHSLDQLDEVIRRDFEAKAPTGTEILRRIEAGDNYRNRYELMRDVALNLFWANRFAMTMYEKRPTRWRGRAEAAATTCSCRCWRRGRTDERKVDAVADGYAALPPRLGRAGRGRDLRGAVRRVPAPAHHATELPAVKPTVAQLCRAGPADLPAGRLRPRLPGLRLRPRSSTAPRTCPSWRRCTAGRWCCTTSTRGTGAQTELTAVGELRDDDYVVLFHPRNREVRDSSAALRAGRAPCPSAPPKDRDRPSRRCAVPCGATCASGSRSMPRLEALAVVHGEQRVHQRGPDPQQRLQLVADERGGDQRPRPASSSGDYTARPLEEHRAAGRRGVRWPRRAAHPRRSARCWSAPAPTPG